MNEDLQQQVNRIEETLNKFIDQYNRNTGPSSQIFTKNTYFKADVSLGDSGSLVSVYGEEPVAQAPAISAVGTPSGIYVFTEALAVATAINDIRLALKNFGITS